MEEDEITELKNRCKKLAKELGRFTLLSQGSVMAQPPSAWRWTRKVSGKTVSRGLSAEQAELILFVIDARDGIVPLDEMVAKLIRTAGLSQKVISVANKVDDDSWIGAAQDATRLGFGEPHMVSANNGSGLRRLREAIWERVGDAPAKPVPTEMKVAIVGRRNAGKSSFTNALAGEDRVIVSEIAGTTRDAIESVLDRAPLPLRFVDTAGLRDTADEIERLGIEVSTRYLGQAQVVLACGACAADIEATTSVIASRTDGIVIPVHTKVDLGVVDTTGTAIGVSAETGQGIRRLLEVIDRAAAASAVGLPAGDAVLVTRERHRAGLAAAHEELAEFLLAWESGALPAPVAAVHLYAARESLSDLIGVVDTEDVLDRVFREFCIGK